MNEPNETTARRAVSLAMVCSLIDPVVMDACQRTMKSSRYFNDNQPGVNDHKSLVNGRLIKAPRRVRPQAPEGEKENASEQKD